MATSLLWIVLLSAASPEQLVADLDHPSFRVRQRASAQLTLRGYQAQSALVAGLARPRSLEQERRCARLLQPLVDDFWRRHRAASISQVDATYRPADWPCVDSFYLIKIKDPAPYYHSWSTPLRAWLAPYKDAGRDCELGVVFHGSYPFRSDRLGTRLWAIDLVTAGVPVTWLRPILAAGRWHERTNLKWGLTEEPVAPTEHAP